MLFTRLNCGSLSTVNRTVREFLSLSQHHFCESLEINCGYCLHVKLSGYCKLNQNCDVLRLLLNTPLKPNNTLSEITSGFILLAAFYCLVKAIHFFYFRSGLCHPGNCCSAEHLLHHRVSLGHFLPVQLFHLGSALGLLQQHLEHR